ncbi:small capsid protein [Macacine alphaherpesvirus 1]|uniref:Small capsomere-interacting protein n=2 Tax=Cercopithecine herpesvirus 1 TaxID=10325 RepID=Q805Z3_CHV1|nr:small capsid protein [Macacine alphaherpesvirus 1]AAP41453.1 capsid protein VP26 [Macacine alphaherpesvirus 1]ARS01897.1 small capsid protein [Macacine alphaherpesvirus 1]ARS01972.1 small capsid protein [Macacine alphaherpesvirus 1]ARS02047.1 small capsid protein [Macacine alphaherpesvirus 1]ARS02122.1 small capsid protein [Macacine alphaherpesvirus 1]
MADADPRFHLPDTLHPERIQALGLREIVLAVNEARPIDHTHDHPLGNRAAARNFIRGQAGALADLCRAHANHTLELQPMFSREAPGAWLRPAFGLRRTYMPFLAAPNNQPAGTP